MKMIHEFGMNSNIGLYRSIKRIKFFECMNNNWFPVYFNKLFG